MDRGVAPGAENPTTTEVTAPRPRHRLSWLWGPAFVAAIAYVDPGNVAANLTAGSRYGYLLVWVLVLANAMAVLVQYLSAKVGLVTGHSLPEILGDRLRRGPRIAYWLQAEVVAAATDLAEVIGGAIALQILFGLPLVVGGIVIGVVSMALLSIQTRRGQRPFEFVVMGLLLVVTIGFMTGLFFSDVSWGEAGAGLLPRFAGADSVLIAAGMLGATVMPHAIYVHSALARDRHGGGGTDLGRLLRATRWDVVVSMVVAGAVNIAMLLLAAASLQGVGGTDSIQGAHAAISTALGPAVGVLFGIGLLASGLASTSVGCYAGAAIMSGLLRIRVPMVVRRAVTLIPALLILGSGVNPTWALVLSQVLLSVGIPFALAPLVWLTGRPTVMGRFANSLALRVVAWVVVGLIVALNLVLVWLTMTGES
ncbi:Nramp family divalent metal transporter [Propionicicella superfundia]|uniref:Nramp family divalent metal transporter n=1 Tax=Propionicicella superfundia TaxID=348582 RepID=UPI000569B328|nr:Nramp family divalent metal transporter [Propionicicella superfundia]